jgi:hypothetical protein
MAPATVRPGPAMTEALEGGQATVRLGDGRVLIMGGTVPFTGKCEMACIATVAMASVEIYDPGTGKFSPAGSLAEPRADGEALLLNDGRVLVSGGRSSGDLSTIEIYDPAQRTSVVVKPPADMKELPAEPSVVQLTDGRVLIAGGSYDYVRTSTTTLIFDPASGGFSNGPLMAEPRQGATAALLGDGRVLIVGGEYSEGGYIYHNKNAELIDPSHPLSKSTSSVSQYYPATSTLLSDGRVLVTEWGPYDSGASCITPGVSEVFDPRTERFTPLGPMSTPRTGSTAIKIQDGRVLFFGGVDSHCAAVGTVEAFDPDSGTFQVIATELPKIRGFSLTLLDDGEILIAGGGDGGDGDASMAASCFFKP